MFLKNGLVNSTVFLRDSPVSVNKHGQNTQGQ